MGYYTSYVVDVSSIPEEKVDAVYKHLSNLDVFDTLDAYKNTINGYSYSKWYEWENDMLSLSEEFPDVFIEIEGDGEDSDDFWKCYIKDGAQQLCPATITYEQYDPKKMQQIRPPHLPEIEASVADLI